MLVTIDRAGKNWLSLLFPLEQYTARIAVVETFVIFVHQQGTPRGAGVVSFLYASEISVELFGGDKGQARDVMTGRRRG